MSTTFRNRTDFSTDGAIPFNLQWLQQEAVGFSVHGDQVKVLFTPEQFYSAIIDECYNARHRITLAALYIGTGSLEKKLVEALDKQLTKCGEDLKVTILLDAVRDSRDRSARTMLLPLVQKHPQCHVSLYRTPELNGIWWRLLPSKVNELIGIQHIKLYVFDNNTIITGANMTKEYFMNRQDRYIQVSDCRPVADFCSGLVEKICSVSLRLLGKDRLEPPLTLPSSGLYEKQARALVWGYYQQAFKDCDKVLKPGDDTWLFPLLQLPSFDILQDSTATQTLLESLDSQVTVHFSSAYFNMPDEYVTSVLHKCKACFKVLIPHPTANDFYTANGFASQIPWLYSTLATIFLQKIEESKQSARFSIHEFMRPPESFHSKGVWLTAPGDNRPFMTIVGSSNFNCRSVKRDLECQIVLLTSNNKLRQTLAKEKQCLYQHGVPFTQEVAASSERKPKLWHHLFLWFLKSYL